MRKVILLLMMATCTAGAADLVRHDWPMTGDLYTRVDLDTVRYDGLRTFPEWLRLVAEQNPDISRDLVAEPVVGMDIRLDEDEDPQAGLESFIDQAKEGAARVGANLIFADDTVKDIEHDAGFVAAHFTAYRAQYKGHLVPPVYLAALAGMTMSPHLLDEEVVQWEVSHNGREGVSFAHIRGMDREQGVLDYVRRLKDGTQLRIILDDGTELRGAYSGLDADDQVWIHPSSGLVRFFSDRSVQPKDVQFLALLN